MLISIITVCFNSEATIARTIESLASQNYRDFEYVIVDGLSSDKTVEIANGYKSIFEKMGVPFTVISERDKGIYDAMNKGIALARGDIIGMINSDDWYEPDALKTVAERYASGGFDMFYADLNVVKPSGKVYVKRSKITAFPTSRHWNHPTTFIAKRVYEELGCYACRDMYDDLDMFLRVIKSGKKIVVENKVIASFTLGGVSNRGGLKDCFSRIKIRYDCYRRNKYGFLSFFECFFVEIAKYLLS